MNLIVRKLHRPFVLIAFCAGGLVAGAAQSASFQDRGQNRMQERIQDRMQDRVRQQTDLEQLDTLNKLRHTSSTLHATTALFSGSPSARLIASINPILQTQGQTQTETQTQSAQLFSAKKDQASEPLAAELAFVPSARRSEKAIELKFQIAPHYYLYRERLKVAFSNQSTVLPLQLPKGEVKFDETFGKQVQTYRAEFFFPPIPHAKLNETVNVDVYSQGCADIGVCYPPQQHRVSFAAGQKIGTIGAVEINRALFEKEVQTLAASVKSDQRTAASKGEASIESNELARASNVANNRANAKDASNEQSGVGSDIGHPPLESAVNTRLDIQNIGIPNSVPSNTVGSSISVIESAQHQMQAVLNANEPIKLIILFLGLGLLLALTPCVLPMVPIVSAIVLGRTQQVDNNEGIYQRTSKEAFLLTLSYVLGMSVTYTMLGIAAGLAGAGFAAQLQQPWVLIVFALLMVVLAGAQFGWYQLSLPQRFIERLTGAQSTLGKVQQSKKINTAIESEYKPSSYTPQLKPNWHSRIKQYGSIVLMGALSALLVGPCVTAPLAAVLAHIAQTGDAWKGGQALFSLSIGMGFPLLLIGLGGQRFLPKAGAWMQRINIVLGLLLLAAALWIIQWLLPIELSTAMWLCLLLALAYNFGGFQVFASNASRQLATVVHLFGFVLLIWAVAIVLGMAGGRFNALQPLSLAGVQISSNAQAPSLKTNLDSHSNRFQTVASQTLLEQIKRGSNKPILLDVYADWCVSCIEFERYTFTDKAVILAMENFHLLRIDVTQNTAHDQRVLKQLGIFGPPTIVFFNPRGEEVTSTRVIGFQSASLFSQHLKKILSTNRLLKYSPVSSPPPSPLARST